MVRFQRLWPRVSEQGCKWLAKSALNVGVGQARKKGMVPQAAGTA